MRIPLSLLFLSFFCFPAMAAEYLDRPICFKVVNDAPYGVYGDVATAPDVNADGTQVTHTATFRLKKGESYDLCTTGPLIGGSKVRLTLRTLIPIFECETMIYEGARLRIQGRLKKDGMGAETWAECL